MNPVAFELDEGMFAKNVRSARKGAAPGPSGMAVEHLRPLLDNPRLDDVYIVCSPERVSAINAILQEELWGHARIRIHHGKTQGEDASVEPVWQPPRRLRRSGQSSSRTGSRVHYSVERRRRTSAPRNHDPRNALGS